MSHTDLTNVINTMVKTFSEGDQIRVKEYKEKYEFAEDRVICFVDMDRPFANGDILGDIQWRRDHRAPMKPSDAKRYFTELFSNFGLEIEKVSYNRKAGCSMCPCSPGYVVKIKGGTYRGRRIAIWS